MSRNKLLEKLRELLENPEDANKKHIKKLRKVLKELKRKQKELEAQLEEATESRAKSKIQMDIEVLKLQRQKGVKVYKELKNRDEPGQL